MAEGLARATAPDGWEVHSAGSRPAHLSQGAVRAMAEVNIDISHHRAKGLDDVPIADAAVVVTLCAEEECPVAVTRARRVHWPLPDPARGDDAGAPARFREVRDELARRIAQLWKELAP